jgi:hypothetical protein
MSGSALGKYIDWSKSRKYWNSAAVPLSLRTRTRSGPHRQTVVSSKAGLRTSFLPEPGPRRVIFTQLRES